MQRAVVFATIQPQWNLGTTSQRQRKVIMTQAQWRDVQRLCKAAGNYAVEDTVFQVARGDRYLARTLRRVLACGQGDADLRAKMEELAEVSELGLGLTRELQEVHRNEFHQACQQAAATPAPTPEENPSCVYRPR